MPPVCRGFTSLLLLKPMGRPVIQADMHSLSKTQTIVSWLLQLVAAGILLQTLFFKFTGAEESVYIFTTLGVEPWGRIRVGCRRAHRLRPHPRAGDGADWCGPRDGRHERRHPESPDDSRH